jgi:hypothetical protein
MSCLRSLRPVEAVRALLWPRTGAEGLDAMVGVHVRMLVDQSADVPGIESDARPESNLKLMNETIPFREACDFDEP